MAMSIRASCYKKEDYPVITWTPGNSTRARVESTQNGNGRKFCLIDDSTIKTYVETSIQEIGYCLQKWVRCDHEAHQEIRMFAIRRIQVYFVVTDLKKETINVCSETLSDQMRKQRMYYQEPSFQRCFLTFWSRSMTWVKESAISSVWRRSYEKSEEGLIRREIDVLGEEKITQVEFCVYSEQARLNDANQGPSQWAIIHRVITALENNMTKIVYRIFNPDNMGSEEVEYSQKVPCPSLQELKDKVHVGMHGRNSGEFLAQLGLCHPSANPDSLYLNFMPNEKNLGDVSLETIHKYVLETSAKKGSYEKFLRVTRETHQFENGLILPSVRISMDQGFFQVLVKSVMAFVRGPSKLLGERWKGEIQEELITTAVLGPCCADAGSFQANDRDPGIKELNIAFERGASVNLFISFDKWLSEISVDQSQFSGIKCREAVSKWVIMIFMYALMAKNLLQKTGKNS